MHPEELISCANQCTHQQPLGSSPNAQAFFESYLAGPVVIFFYIVWKLWSRNWSWYVKAHEMDLDTGRRSLDLDTLAPVTKRGGVAGYALEVFHMFF